MELIDLRFKDPRGHGFREKAAGPFLILVDQWSYVTREFDDEFYPLCWIMSNTGELNDTLKTDGR